jgi:hypothetical protein
MRADTAAITNFILIKNHLAIHTSLFLLLEINVYFGHKINVYEKNLLRIFYAFSLWLSHGQEAPISADLR